MKTIIISATSLTDGKLRMISKDTGIRNTNPKNVMFLTTTNHEEFLTKNANNMMGVKEYTFCIKSYKTINELLERFDKYREESKIKLIIMVIDEKQKNYVAKYIENTNSTITSYMKS